MSRQRNFFIPFSLAAGAAAFLTAWWIRQGRVNRSTLASNTEDLTWLAQRQVHVRDLLTILPYKRRFHIQQLNQAPFSRKNSSSLIQPLSNFFSKLLDRLYPLFVQRLSLQLTSKDGVLFLQFPDCQLDRLHVEALVLSGALDYLGERRQLLWDIAEAYRLAKRPRELPLRNIDEQVSLLPMDQATRLSTSFALTGTSLDAHLTELCRDVFIKAGATPISELPWLKHGQRVKIGGPIVARQHPLTAKGFAFLAVEEPGGMSTSSSRRIFMRAIGPRYRGICVDRWGTPERPQSDQGRCQTNDRSVRSPSHPQ